MRFGILLLKLAIPEWRACYINYHLLKKLLKVFIEIHDLKELRIQNGNIYDSNEQQLYQNNMLNELNKIFFRLHRDEMYVTFMFFQVKLIEIKDKLSDLQKCTFVEKGNEQFLYMLEVIYIEVHYIKNLYEINLEGERKILKKHKKVVKQFKLVSPATNSQNILRLVPVAKQLKDSIEQIYISKSNNNSKQARLHLRELISTEQEDTIGSFFFGMGIGIGLSIIGLIIALQELALKPLDQDPVFSRDFPVWRGLSFFMIYMWVLAIDVYMFERHHINHRLVFKFTDYHASTSTQAFYRASIFTAVYLILFLLYIIQGVYQTTFIPGERIYQGGVVWIMFILYILCPFKIFNWKGRLYMWKTIGLCVIAPLYQVNFPIIFTTDQFISLVNPLKDFAYTICYYTVLDLRNSTSSSQCSGSIEVVFATACIALVLRILQCIKLGYDNKHYFFAPVFYNSLKYLSSLLTLLFSYLYTAQQPKIFSAWIAFAAISTLFSFYWDIKHDWGLLEKSRKNPFLRDNLSYGSAKVYYCIVIVNFVLRLSWIFTLSPNIVASFHIMPGLFSLLTGSLEILRRGLWNLLRVEKEHLANCAEFRAISNVNPKDILASSPEGIDTATLKMFDQRRMKLLAALRSHVSKRNELIIDAQELVKNKNKEIKKLMKAIR